MRAIVLVLNGCNINGLGPYGNEWIATPCLDRLASESVIFDHHFTDHLDPAVVRQAWRSGRYHPSLPTETPSVHMEPDLIDTLGTVGVKRILIRESNVDDAFAQGWDQIIIVEPQPEQTPRVAFHGVVERTLQSLADTPDFLVWLELDRLLPPWDVPLDRFEAYYAPLPEELPQGEEIPPFELPPPCDNPEPAEFDRNDRDAWDWLHASFAAVVTELDEEIGEFMKLFASLGHDRDALWVWTADVGYPLAEHGYLGLLQPWPHAEAVHVPFLVRLPEAANQGSRVPVLTQSVDLAPTLLEAFQTSAPEPTMHGQSLWPLLFGESRTIREFALFTGSSADLQVWGIRSEEWSWMVPLPVCPGSDSLADDRDRFRLYRKPDDRWEVNDLHSHLLDWCERVEQMLTDWLPTLWHREGTCWPQLPAEDADLSEDGETEEKR